MQVLGIIIILALIYHFGTFFLLLGAAAFIFWLLVKLLGGKDKSDRTSEQPQYDSSGGYGYSRKKPKPTSDNGNEFWVPAGASVDVAGYSIPGGMLYMGTGLAAPSGYDVDCALIDPKLTVNRLLDDYSVRKTNYWPSYSDVSPEARAAFLNWLSKGKKDPRADIGYVFLYFYGLERRLLHDAQQSPLAQDESEAILNEISRLLTIYGNNGSFYTYANSLLSYMELEKYQGCSLSNLKPPVHSNHAGFSMPLRLGLGLMAVEEATVPADWALSWYCSSPNPPAYTRTAAQRCGEEFGRLFAEEYSRKFGAGIKLAKNKTMLSVSHRPASKSLLGSGNYTKSLNIPDVTVLTSPLNKMAPIIQVCHDKLDSYSRLLGRSPEKTGTLDAYLELPVSLWPDNARGEIEKFKSSPEANGSFQQVKFSDVLAKLPVWKDKSKKKMSQFLEAIEGQGLGFEPDLRYGGPVPDIDSYVVLYGLDENKAKADFDTHYSIASLSMYLAMVVSNADGQASEREISLLQNQLERWLHLKPAEQKRLKAHVLWLSKQQLNLAGIQKRIEALDKGQREFIGNLLVQVAQVDGQVNVEELKLMERIYRLLGLDTTSLYSKVHTAASEPVTITQSPAQEGGYAIPAAPAKGKVKLDMSKVAALQADSARVTSILSTIFKDETAADSQPEIEEDDVKDDVIGKEEETLLGLSKELSALVQLLCQKPVWQRAELEELAQDRGLMLEGALEQINEAAFEKHDQAFADGDDPIEINQEIAAVISQ